MNSKLIHAQFSDMDNNNHKTLVISKLPKRVGVVVVVAAVAVWEGDVAVLRASKVGAAC